MSKKKKTIHEIATSFHVNLSEIARLFGCGAAMANKIFVRARAIEWEELHENYLDSNKVRLTTVLKVMGISEEEFQRKIASRESE